MKLTPIEKLTSVIQAFWTFDAYRPYSINFLWGPVLGTNPAEVELLYYYLPPPFTMGMWAFNCFLAGAVVLGGIGYYVLRNKKIIKVLLVLVVGMWLLLDIRMGSEFLSWVYHDYSTYISVSPKVREFRERERFYDFAEFVKPLIQDRDRYIFFAEVPWPYLGNMRYLTYPILPAFNLKEDDTWVIYKRPDIGFTKEGQLVIGSTIVSEPGRLLGEFDRGSFVFRAKPLPIPVK